MKYFLMLLVLMSWTCVSGQLRTSYELIGIAMPTVGPKERFKSRIVLRTDSSFLWISERYDYHKRSFISADTAIGKWTKDGKILKLDHNPENVDPNKGLDSYEIKRRKIIRTFLKSGWTLKPGDNWATYKGSGTLLMK